MRARWEREEGIAPFDAHRRWFMDRHQITHDLLHVLTGYGTDGAGEAALLAYELPHRRGWAHSLLVAGALGDVYRNGGGRWAHYAFRAWMRGRRATWLALLPIEELLPLRLETVRRLAGVTPVAEAHPGGIARGNDGALVWSH